MALLTQRQNGVGISVRVKPRASRSKILGVREHELEIAVAAPPVDGAANDEVRALIAKALDVPRRDVEIVTGASARSKIVEVAGISLEEARLKLELSGSDA